MSTGACAPVVANGDAAVFPPDPLVLTGPGPAQAAMRKTIGSIRDFWRNERRLTAFLENICCFGIMFPQPLSTTLMILIEGSFTTSFRAEI